MPVKKDTRAAKAAKSTDQAEDTNGAGSEPAVMNVGRFFAFCQCQLKAELHYLMGKKLDLVDKQAIEMWPQVDKMVKRNLGANEKWVPFHTILGIHERYLVEKVHHSKVPALRKCERRRFLASFVFRSHCKADLFEKCQLPFMEKEGFWRDPVSVFEPGPKSPMERSIRAFRRAGNPLQTACFLIIPERLLDDDDENLIHNLMVRTQRLIKLAEDIWPIVMASGGTAREKFDAISNKIWGVRNLGETWVKMLTVVTDLAFPELGLLQDVCEVGTGASEPLRLILEAEGLLQPKVKRELDPVRRALKDRFQCVNLTKVGIITVKKSGKQLIQVTKGLAGSLDRAHAIATLLCNWANQGIQIDELSRRKHALFGDKSVKVPKLGLDAEMERLLTEAPKPPPGPAPSDALLKLRDKLCGSQDASVKNFWKLCADAEEIASDHFENIEKLPLIVKQMTIGVSKILPCSTLQVQLCEYRQFENQARRDKKERESSWVGDIAAVPTPGQRRGRGRSTADIQDGPRKAARLVGGTPPRR